MINEFLTCIATCHSVIPEKREDSREIHYQASSPDEGALVKAIQKFGIVFHSRQPDKLLVKFVSSNFRIVFVNQT